MLHQCKNINRRMLASSFCFLRRSASRSALRGATYATIMAPIDINRLITESTSGRLIISQLPLEILNPLLSGSAFDVNGGHVRIHFAPLSLKPRAEAATGRDCLCSFLAARLASRPTACGGEAWSASPPPERPPAPRREPIPLRPDLGQSRFLAFERTL